MTVVCEEIVWYLIRKNLSLENLIEDNIKILVNENYIKNSSDYIGIKYWSTNNFEIIKL